MCLDQGKWPSKYQWILHSIAYQEAGWSYFKLVIDASTLVYIAYTTSSPQVHFNVDSVALSELAR